ncbi:hypothetical protein HPP92_028543, partial [Vanilla planifolia]
MCEGKGVVLGLFDRGEEGAHNYPELIFNDFDGSSSSGLNVSIDKETLIDDALGGYGGV